MQFYSGLLFWWRLWYKSRILQVLTANKRNFLINKAVWSESKNYSCFPNRAHYFRTVPYLMRPSAVAGRAGGDQIGDTQKEANKQFLYAHHTKILLSCTSHCWQHSTAQHTVCTKMSTKFRITRKVTVRMFGFVVYRFRNRKVKWRLNEPENTESVWSCRDRLCLFHPCCFHRAYDFQILYD